jgi:hypothetical protein
VSRTLLDKRNDILVSLRNQFSTKVQSLQLHDRTKTANVYGIVSAEEADKFLLDLANNIAQGLEVPEEGTWTTLSCEMRDGAVFHEISEHDYEAFIGDPASRLVGRTDIDGVSYRVGEHLLSADDTGSGWRNFISPFFYRGH